MNYDLLKVMLDHRGEPIKDGEENVTLGNVLEQALVNGNSPNTDGKSKYQQFKLAQRVYQADKLSLSAEEVAFIKELAAPIYSPIALGSLYEALESPDHLAGVVQAGAYSSGDLPVGDGSDRPGQVPDRHD